jgi:hypothetical protein
MSEIKHRIAEKKGNYQNGLICFCFRNNHFSAVLPAEYGIDQ